MATKKCEIGSILLILALMLCGRVFGQSSCSSSTLLRMSPCINYVTGNTTSTPSTSCCTSLANIVRSQPQCLCPLLNAGGGYSSFGISINQTLAMALPALCNVQTPPLSRCNGGADGPATAPPPAPAPAPAHAPSPLGFSTDGSTEPTDDTPATSTVPSTSSSGSGSTKTVPATSDGSTLLSSTFQLIAFAFVALNLFSV